MRSIHVLLFFILLAFVAVIVKLAYIQVHFSLPQPETKTVMVKKITPARGSILDAREKPLASTVRSFTLFAEPHLVENVKDVAQKLEPFLLIGEATIEARIDPQKKWVSLARAIQPTQKNEIEKLNLKGIGFQQDPGRFYPEASLAAHLLGFVGKNAEGGNIGYFGIEGYYDRDLTGLPGVLKSERGGGNLPIFFGQQERLDEENGRTLVLTIDSSIQQIIKTHLTSALEKYGAKEGCVIIADPNTMAIYGLACLPDFDPNSYAIYPSDFFRNPTISSLYEPGSTFKPIVVASALQANAIKPDQIFDEGGPIRVEDAEIRTWNNEYIDKISVSQILERSSNVGMVKIGEKLGNAQLYEYVQKFGFGSLTEIDLQGESGAKLRDKRDMYPVDYATLTFGQGVNVTPIQMVQAFAAVINGGKLMRPYVVKEFMDSKGKVNKVEPFTKREVISPVVSAQVRKMLVSTVEGGEYHYAIPSGYVFGGKTGTAQIPIEGHYDKEKTITSFIGFAPAANPKFVMLTMLKEPSSSIYGSETAAPLFFDIARDLLVYLNIAPE